MKKIRVAVLFGGRSAEHEISLLSAKNVIDAIDRNKYEVVLIGIDKTGEWHVREQLSMQTAPHQVTLACQSNNKALVSLSRPGEQQTVDVVFPVLHGPYGEDGAVQGLLKMANIPFVGSGILGSAVGMDKDVMKRLLRDAGLSVATFIAFSRTAPIPFEEIRQKIGYPLFVKPANLGSSVGISKVKQEKDLEPALRHAFQYDHKVIVEEHIEGREIECSVLGNEHPIVSIPGEIIPSHEFYSYEAKYLDEKGAVLEIPAKISVEDAAKVQDLALKAYVALCSEGMARVDCFLKKNGDVLINEINTIPGFTQISMYPKLWEASGISYPELIDRLIQLAIERHEREKQLYTS